MTPPGPKALRDWLRTAFGAAVAALDPERAVGEALRRLPSLDRPIGVSVGKAALAMARGVGPVARGICVTHADDGRALPAGWERRVAGHPEPDDRSVAAGEAILALLSATSPAEQVIACVSGGASALAEVPVQTLAALVAASRASMASGTPIAELNRVRALHSRLKAGRLAAATPARILTLVASDVVGDRIDVIGSGPTVAPGSGGPARPGDRVVLVASIRGFAEAVVAALADPNLGERSPVRLLEPPLAADVAIECDRVLAAHRPGETLVAYGEPTVRVPDSAGDGGRAQQLALLLAARIRGTARIALVAGSDGRDGTGRHGAAGAIVDGTTWDAILAAGLDPRAALARCDAGSALAAAHALLVTGPTGVNHADVLVLA